MFYEAVKAKVCERTEEVAPSCGQGKIVEGCTLTLTKSDESSNSADKEFNIRATDHSGTYWSSFGPYAVLKEIKSKTLEYWHKLI